MSPPLLIRHQAVTSIPAVNTGWRYVIRNTPERRFSLRPIPANVIYMILMVILSTETEHFQHESPGIPRTVHWYET